MSKSVAKSRSLPKHMFVSTTGIYQYRRRVPDHLKETLGRKEIRKSLGKDYGAALAKHAKLEAETERAFSQKPPKKGSNIVAIIRGRLQEHGIGLDDIALLNDPSSDEYEAAAVVIHDLLEEMDAEGFPAEPLMETARGRLPVTLETALDEWGEWQKADKPGAGRQIDNRVERHKRRLIEYLGANAVKSRLLVKLKRPDARRVVEGLSRDVTSPRTVKRYVNDIKAAVSRVIVEHDLDMSNPFHRIEIKGSQATRDDRHPLEGEDMLKLEPVMNTDDDLGLIWAVLRDTGARPKEIVGLRGSDVDHARQTILIRDYEDWDVKTSNSVREVPVPAEVVDRLTRKVDPKDPKVPLFRQYAKNRGNDSCTQALNKRMDKVLPDPEKALYGLRHRMKDRLRDTDCPEDLQREIMGHSAQSIAANYGRGPSLEKKRAALKKVWRLDR